MPHTTLDTTAKLGKQAQNFCNRFCVESGKNACWVWHGSLHITGHGQFHPTAERMYHAHRYSYELFKGEIPTDGKRRLVDHLCRNRACVNPEHLELVNHEENLKRGYHPLVLGQKYWCKANQHPLTKDSIIFDNKGNMHCVKCSKEEIHYEPVLTQDWGA